MSERHHDHASAAPRRVRFAVLTVSDTRQLQTDRSGAVAVELLEGAGHEICDRSIVPDEPARIRAYLDRWLAEAGCDAVLVTGGTGVSPRDRTYEAVQPRLERELHGFGELFRWLSFQEVGPRAILGRALAGTCGPKAVFVVPGSPGAVRLALERLVLPVLAHLLAELRRSGRRGEVHDPDGPGVSS